MTAYAYRGNPRLIECIEKRLGDAGFIREGEPDAASIVLTYCSNMTALEELYFGDAGLLQTMVPGSIAVDLSPASCSFATEMAAVATVSDLVFVSSPLSVKNKVSKDAFSRSNLICFAGVDEGSIPEEAIKLIDTICADVRVMPDVSTAQLVRAASVLQNTAEMVAAVETMSLFKVYANKFSDAQLADIVPDATSPEAFFIMKAISESNYQGDYTVEMLMGELSAAIMCADDCELILPQAEAAFHLFELLAIVGGVDLSPAALELVYEGEQSEEAAKAGLDWSRMEGLYGESDHQEDDYDDPFDMFDDDDGEDALSPGFGYSFN